MGFNSNEKKDAINFLKDNGYKWNSDNSKMINGNKSASFSESGQSMKLNGSHYNDSNYKKSKKL